jgi:N-acyl homoserine lactone hydrolase
MLSSAAKPLYPNVSTIVKLKRADVKIHGLCTGVIAVKTALRTKKGVGAAAKLNILLDNQFTEYMPVWVWVIEHPEGVIAIDTGENYRAMDTGAYLADEGAYARFLARHTTRLCLEPTDGLVYQLAKINMQPQAVSLVVLTHLHSDHTGGLHLFPNTPIIVSRLEFEHPYANSPTTYPLRFKPQLVDYQKDITEIFNSAYPLTKSGELLYIPTPGHTSGHSSVLFKTDAVDIIFAGDTSYNQVQLLRGEIAGVNKDFRKTKETYKNLLSYAALRPTIYLPAHDGQSGIRLLNKTILLQPNI